ncbi:MAG: hypothetical protein WAM60_15055 [Candidatus Promineifilaceae bacterium]
MNRHPLAQISPAARPAIFAVLLAATLLIMVVLNVTGNHLRTAEAPAAIVSYELAGTVNRADAILNSWANAAKVYAGFNLGFDYLWMIFYSTTIALGLIWTAEALQLKGNLAAILYFLAWGQWLAALLDALENTALLTMLFGQPAAPWPQIAYWSAVIKFTLVILGILITLGGAVLYRLRR